MKTCFVISPIGQEGSPLRQNADDVFELIIEPAFEKFKDFDVVRGDMVSNTASITDDIIKRIQNSELCIIDLTGHNPNVFYECGRRHETAKPFILMKKAGEPIPFDLQDIRTIDYDLTDPRTTRNSVEKLRNFITYFENAGYGSQSSTASLTSIATALTRIERKLDGMVGTALPGVITKETSKTVISDSPALVFSDAIRTNDTQTAIAALKRFMQINGDINLHLDMASMLVEAYEPAGVPLVRAIIDRNFEQLEPGKLAIALHGLYTFYHGAFLLENEHDYLIEQTNKALKKQNISKKDEAALYNVLASVEYSMKNDLQSLQYQKKTIELNPSEPTYYYNAARTYESLGMQDDLEDCLNMLVTIFKNRDPQKEKINVKFLEYARNFFIQKNDTNKLNEIDSIIAGTKTTPQNATANH